MMFLDDLAAIALVIAGIVAAAMIIANPNDRFWLFRCLGLTAAVVCAVWLIGPNGQAW